MTITPKTIEADEMAVNAMEALRKYDITQGSCCKRGEIFGIIHLHDLVRGFKDWIRKEEFIIAN